MDSARELRLVADPTRAHILRSILRAFGGDRIEVRSAGSEPKEQINPVAVVAMAEAGIDITGSTPKILTVDAVRGSDVVITMGCRERPSHRVSATRG